MDAAAFCALSKFDCCSQCRNANTRRATTLRMTTTRAVWFFIVALTAIRLSMLATTDLEFDEAHYWMWSERLAPAYFSKGPGIAFAIRASAAVFTFWLALEKSPQFSWYWPLAGLLIGLGFLSKYTNALELVSIVLVLALAPRLRHEFKHPGFYLLLGIFALCTVPPIMWNAQ